MARVHHLTDREWRLLEAAAFGAVQKPSARDLNQLRDKGLLRIEQDGWLGVTEIGFEIVFAQRVIDFVQTGAVAG